MEKQLVIYSGPSGIGKGPMYAALTRLHNEHFAKIILYTSRAIRTSKGEAQDVTYHFRSEDEIRSFDPNRYIIAPVRSDWQAIDMEEVKEVLSGNDLVVVEVYPTLGQELVKWLKLHPEFDSFRIKTIAIVPMSDMETDLIAQIFGTSREDVIYRAIKGKLERRASESDTAEKIEERAKMAEGEIQAMAGYQYRIVNHVGEDNVKEWSDPLGLGPARVVEEFYSIICGEKVSTRSFSLIWHDYEDGCSHSTVISVKNDEDPEAVAYRYLQDNVGQHQYMIEEIKEEKSI